MGNKEGSSKYKGFIQKTFLEHRELLLLLACICIPLRLSWTYIVLIAPLLTWCVAYFSELKATYLKAEPISSTFMLLISLSLITSSFGLAPLESIFELLRFAFVALTALYIFALIPESQTIKYMGILCITQAIASLHSIADSAFSDAIPRFFHGTMTESGQLALTIPLTAGILLYFHKHKTHTISPLSSGLLLTLNTAILCIAGFAPRLGLPSITLLLAVTAVVLVYFAGLFIGKKKAIAIDNLLVGIVIPLLFAALIVNLKRGPWSGVFAVTFLFFALQSWRLYIPLLAGASALLFLLEPIRERLLYSTEHFFIAGGRGEIWRVGGELIQRFPLGIGFHNSSFMHKFSVEIPPELEHFHSNTINILVETGWIGFLLYLSCLILLAQKVIRNYQDPVVLGCGLSLLSWQIAGIVEYNIGDSEVFILAMCICGILFRRIATLESHKPKERVA